MMMLTPALRAALISAVSFAKTSFSREKLPGTIPMALRISSLFTALIGCKAVSASISRRLVDFPQAGRPRIMYRVFIYLSLPHLIYFCQLNAGFQQGVLLQ